MRISDWSSDVCSSDLYYGSDGPISQVANVNLIDARTISVQVWEKPLAGLVERAIRDSDLGLNPIAMGDNIRVPMPALTEERRRDLTKEIGSTPGREQGGQSG